MAGRCLIADAEPGVRSGIRSLLQSREWEVMEARTCHEARAFFLSARPDVVLLDDRLPGGSVLELLPEMRALSPSTPLILLTANASMWDAVQAIKLGAEHLLPKPVMVFALLELVERLWEAQRARARAAPGAQAMNTLEELKPFLGVSPLIRQLEATAHRVLGSDRSILIQGETGTGKGVLATWIHQHGPRAQAPLVHLNCAGLSPQLLETELFGHERGAFTSAVSRKPGLLEVAHRGTVFLDEVGDMDPLIQPKLLKVLEEKRFRRLGEVEDRLVDIRLIAATHRDLVERVKAQLFREDLYFRISTLPLRVPALRERTEDIPLLARALLARLSHELRRPELGLTSAAESALCAYPWPGNIRELRNVLDRAVLFSSSPLLRVEDLHFNAASATTLLAHSPGEEPHALEHTLTLREVERRHIVRVLAAEQGNVARAARRLGIPRSSLYQKLKSLGLSSKV